MVMIESELADNLDKDSDTNGMSQYFSICEYPEKIFMYAIRIHDWRSVSVPIGVS